MIFALPDRPDDVVFRWRPRPEENVKFKNRVLRMRKRKRHEICFHKHPSKTNTDPKTYLPNPQILPTPQNILAESERHRQRDAGSGGGGMRAYDCGSGGIQA